MESENKFWNMAPLGVFYIIVLYILHMNLIKYMHQNRGYGEHRDIDLQDVVYAAVFLPSTAYHGWAAVWIWKQMQMISGICWHLQIFNRLYFYFKRLNVKCCQCAVHVNPTVCMVSTYCMLSVAVRTDDWSEFMNLISLIVALIAALYWTNVQNVA